MRQNHIMSENSEDLGMFWERHKKKLIMLGILLLLVSVLFGLWTLAGKAVEATPYIPEDNTPTAKYQMPSVKDEDIEKYDSMKYGDKIRMMQRMLEEMRYTTEDETIEVKEISENEVDLVYRDWTFNFRDRHLHTCTKTSEPTADELEYMGQRYTVEKGAWIWELF